MYGKYSIFNMMREVRDKQPLIQAYLKGESVEGYKHKNNNESGNGAALFGMRIGTGLLFFALAIGIWVWALVVTIKYWNRLPAWAQILAIIGLLPTGLGPLVTLIAVYVGKSQGGMGGGMSNYRSRY